MQCLEPRPERGVGQGTFLMPLGGGSVGVLGSTLFLFRGPVMPVIHAGEGFATYCALPALAAGPAWATLVQTLHLSPRQRASRRNALFAECKTRKLSRRWASKSRPCVAISTACSAGWKWRAGWHSSSNYGVPRRWRWRAGVVASNDITSDVINTDTYASQRIAIDCLRDGFRAGRESDMSRSADGTKVGSPAAGSFHSRIHIQPEYTHARVVPSASDLSKAGACFLRSLPLS